jgi:pseudouridine synthase
MENKIRLNKYLSLCGLGSRRKCDEHIEKGLVNVNGKICREMGLRVDSNDKVLFDGKPIKPEEIVYVLLNKPTGVVTTLKDPEGRPTVAQYFSDLPLIKPVGRLDFNTSGLLLLTNDGDLHYQLIHPKFQVPKLYKALIKGQVKKDIKNKIKTGIRLDDGKVARGTVKEINFFPTQTEVILELREGINREIRRIFDALNYTLLSLDRINFAGLEKGSLKPGKWRYLSPEEIKFLKNLN